MDRLSKIAILQRILSGEVSPKKLKKENVRFVLPSKDGSGNKEVISQYGGKKVYTPEQFKKIEKKWKDNKR